MGRTPCCSKGGLHRGPWTTREDTLLINYIQEHGEGHWRALPKKAGLLRCGKSCRLRWMNYLRPDIKRGNITPDEDDLIIKLHSLLGNRWSLIAGRLPGRTDNEIKNYWNSHLTKKLTVATENAGEGKKKKILPNAENGETSKTKIYLPKPNRVSPFCVRGNNNSSTCTVSGFPLSSGHPEGGSNGGAETKSALPSLYYVNEEEVRNSKECLELEDTRNLVSGCDIFCKGSSNSPSTVDMIDEVQDDYYKKLLNLKGEDYVQLESFIDYFLI